MHIKYTYNGVQLSKTKFLKKLVNKQYSNFFFPFYQKLWHRSYNGHMNQQKLYNSAVIVLTLLQFLCKYCSSICFYFHLLKFKNQLTKGQNWKNTIVPLLNIFFNIFLHKRAIMLQRLSF